jgi:hypothetical protein
MRRLHILLLATLLAACATSAPTVTSRAIGASPATPAASPLDYLLDSAASDFRTHPPTPLGFRNVRYGQMSDGSVRHRLCGEFQVTRSDGTPEWVEFATLKTSAYEQWLGDTKYCSDKVQWAPGDLSAELQRRFDAAR